MKETALLLTKYQYCKNSSAGKNAKTFTAEHWPLHFFLFEAGVLENLGFYKSTLQALQLWLKTLWELIFGNVAYSQPVILVWLNTISNLTRILTTKMSPAKG